MAFALNATQQSGLDNATIKPRVDLEQNDHEYCDNQRFLLKHTKVIYARLCTVQAFV